MVPANRRQKSKFEVLVQARDLAKYTLVITKNANVFKMDQYVKNLFMERDDNGSKTQC